MNEPKKVSFVNRKASGFLEFYYDENDLYQLENMSIDETLKKLTDVSVRLNTKVNM